MRWTKVVALAAAGTVSLAACGGSPSDSKSSESSSSGSGGNSTASAGMVPDAKGPAAEVAGAKKGGTLTVNSAAGTGTTVTLTLPAADWEAE